MEPAAAVEAEILSCDPGGTTRSGTVPGSLPCLVIVLLGGLGDLAGEMLSLAADS